MINPHILNAFQDVLIYTGAAVCMITLPVLIVGLVFSVLQAATQVNEMTLTFIPKMIVMFSVLMLLSPWMLSKLILLMQYYMQHLEYYIR